MKKVDLTLYKYIDTFNEMREKIINHPRFIEYLFNKPLIDFNRRIDYKSTIRLVRLEKKESIQLTGCFFIMMEINDKYMRLYRTVRDKNNFPEIKMTSRDRTIAKILDEREISYIFKWSFQIDGEHLVLSKKPTVNLEHDCVYDFFGMTIDHGQMILFAIVFDTEEHFNRNGRNFNRLHHEDILKQYILFQMNVNLLRLNKHSDVSKDVKKFIRTVRNTNDYVIQNKIRKINNVTDDAFFENYNYNHNIFLSQPVKKDRCYDSEDDEYFNEKEITETQDNEPVDEAQVVSQDFFDRILESKKHLKAPKHSEADKILVELIKRRKN